MASTIIGAGGTASSFAPGALVYGTLSSCQNFTTGTVEAESEYTVNETVTLRNFRAVVSSNLLTSADMVFTIRKNGAATAATFTVPFGSTGTFVNSTDEITLNAGDTFCYEVSVGATGSGTSVVYLVQADLYKASGVTQLLGSRGVLTYTVASTNWNSGFRGQMNTANVTGAYCQIFARTNATLRNIGLNIQTNARTDNFLIDVRKNAVTQFTITVSAGTTGVVVDTSNTVDLADGDSFSFILRGGGTAGTITITQFFAEFVPDSAELKTPIHAGSNLATSGAISGDVYCGTPGITSIYASTRTNAVTLYNFDAVLSDLMMYFSANSSATDHIFAINVNGTDSGVTVTIPAATTGRFTDLANTISVVDGDYITIHHASGGSTARMPALEYHILVTDPVPGVSGFSTQLSRLNLGLGMGLTRYV